MLLYLVGDSTTSRQTELREIIERQTELELERDGVYQVKMRLGDEILQGYETGNHLGVYSARVAECVIQDIGERHHSELLETIKDHLRDVPYGIRGLSSFSDPGISTFVRALNTELPASPTSDSSTASNKDSNHVTILVLLQRGELEHDESL